MDKEVVVPPCPGMLLSDGSEPTIATHNSDDSCRHNSKQKKANTHTARSMYKQFKNGGNESCMLEVRILVTLAGGVTGRWHRTAWGGCGD